MYKLYTLFKTNPRLPAVKPCSMFTHPTTETIPTSFKTEANSSLEEIKQLWKAGYLKEALAKIDEVEEKHPDCSKAANFYRGKISVELLEKLRQLPRNTF